MLKAVVFGEASSQMRTVKSLPVVKVFVALSLHLVTLSVVDGLAGT
jgi:hypothetical protein